MVDCNGGSVKPVNDDCKISQILGQWNTSSSTIAMFSNLKLNITANLSTITANITSNGVPVLSGSGFYPVIPISQPQNNSYSGALGGLLNIPGLPPQIKNLTLTYQTLSIADRNIRIVSDDGVIQTTFYR